ncbi:MAG: DUF4968 domain-containing protein, partial [Ignavibacteriales bacterium]|nr:DUF4968 domain-containing protein [Ignavibacteriales bacterium]
MPSIHLNIQTESEEVKQPILRFVLSAIVFLFFTHYLFSQTYLSNYTRHTVNINTVQVFAGSASVKFFSIKSDILRVDYLPDSTSQSDSSFVVIKSTDGIMPTITETDSSLTIDFAEIAIRCKKYPIRFSFYSSMNKLLLSEPLSGGLATNGKQRIARFNLATNDHFYGTGERGTKLDKRGLDFDSYNVAIGGYQNALPNMNANIPFLASSNRYALYFDNTYRGHYDLGKTNSSIFTYTADCGELTYYLIAQETVSEQLEKYTWLTGRQPLPPKWALGFIQSKYGYRNETEARSMIQTMREKEIPCDAIILDLYWFQHMGDISWNTSAFPDPFGMMSDFLNQGIKTIVITEPYIIEPSSNYSMAA